MFCSFFFLLFLEFDFDNIPPISFGQPLIEMNNRMKLPVTLTFVILLYCYINLHIEQSLTEEEAELVISSNGSHESRMHGFF